MLKDISHLNLPSLRFLTVFPSLGSTLTCILSMQEQTEVGGCLRKGALDWKPDLQNEETDRGAVPEGESPTETSDKMSKKAAGGEGALRYLS